MRNLVRTGVALVIVAACSGEPASQTVYGSNGPPHVAVASIVLQPSQVSLAVSKTARLVAIPKDANGNPLSGRAVQWSSGDTAIATVNDSGVVQALRVGGTGITATSEGVSAAAGLIVASAPVASVVVSLNSSSLVVGQGTQATTIEKDASGNTLTGRSVSFSSSDPTVATVSGTGYVTSVGAGTAVITATSEGVSGTATLTVTAPAPAPVASVTVALTSGSLTVGQATQAVVTLKDASGNTLSGRTITFASSNTGVATVTSTGSVTAVAAGSSVITATSEGVSGSATLTVTAAPPAPVASVSVTLNSGTLTIGQTTQAVVTLKDASGNTLGGRTITFTSGNTSVATVSSTGIVTAVAVGSAVITATSEGVSGSVSVTVAPAPVAAVTVTLNSSSLTAGQTTQAVVTLKDANGNTLTGRTVTYASSNSGVATVSTTGVVSALAAGTAVITATSEGVSGSATLTVTQAPVASVTVTLNSSTLTIGQSTQAGVTLKDASGNTLTGRTITYSSGTPSVATVSSTGLVTAVAAGTAQISATSEGVSGTATVTVTLVPVASVTVTLNSGSLTVGQTTQAVVTLKDASGNTLTGRTVTYASSNTGIATVSSTGLVTAVAAGTAQISATSEGISGSATITVTLAPVASVTVTLNSSSLTVGQSTQAVVVLKDGSGNTLTGRTVTYSSGNTTVATVSSTGLVSAVGAGTAVITATSEGISGTATLTVTLVPVASVTVTLNSSSLTVGQSTQAVVTLKDASGNTLTGRTITYASSNTSVATVTSTGLVSAVAAGTAQISATSEGISGSAALTVQAAPATQLAITTQPSSTAQSGVALAQQPAIQLRNASNNAVSQSGVVVTTAIASGSGGTLGGTMTTTTNGSGVAQFTNLSLTGSGNYTLVFTASGLTSATSATISVSASTGSATLTGISRNAGSTAGGVVVQLTGSGFGASDAVTFGGTPATGVTLLNATTLQATVPAGSAGPVNVTVVHNGTPTTLTNAFTYWPAPTTTYASADFEGGTIPSPFSADGSVPSTAQAHRGSYSALCQATSSAGISGVTYNSPQSVMINGDFYIRWYIFIPAATLTATANTGQIKLYLSRQTTGSGQPGWFMLGEGSDFNSNNNSFASRIDDGIIIVATGPVITPGVWHEIEVYQHRDVTNSIGTSRVWFDGQLQGTATSANMGSNDGTVTYWSRMGIAYTQNASSYPVQVYVDDVVVANGFIDPTP